MDNLEVIGGYSKTSYNLEVIGGSSSMDNNTNTIWYRRYRNVFK